MIISKFAQLSVKETFFNSQGKDLLTYLEKVSCNGKLPVICTGDFNAEPTEPVYQTISDGTENIR